MLVCLYARQIGEDGAPRSIPTGHARWGDTLMLHGKSSSVLMRQIAAGKPVCISIAMVRGPVLCAVVLYCVLCVLACGLTCS